MVLADNEKSRQLISNLDEIVKSLPNKIIASQQLNKDNDKTTKDIAHSNNQRKLI